MEIPFEYGVEVKLKLEYDTESQKTHIVYSDLYLDCNPEQDKAWKHNSHLPNAAGVKAQSQALIQGLITSINYAHQNNLWDSAAHLRFIINELERAFVEVSDVIEVEKQSF